MQQPTQKAEAKGALLTALQRNWSVEMEGAATYRYLAEREQDPNRRRILFRLADGEARHAERWAERLRALGATIPAESPPQVSWITSLSTPDAALRRIEKEEEDHIRIYEEQARRFNDPPSLEIIRDAVRDESLHAETLRSMTGGSPRDPKSRLDRILRSEKWHTTTGSWLGDAIYGANDGLGAVFGIVSGVAGATDNSRQYVLLAGLAGAIASALSMGSGAYLSTKSETEIHQAEVGR
jgi:rubrerythrin